MKILFIGDVFGKGGRNAVKKFLPQILEEEAIELVICNGENLSHGKGILPRHYEEMMDVGVDFFTTGNHAFAKKEGNTLFESEDNIIRPKNIKEEKPGVGTREFDVNGTLIRVTNLLGTCFINELDPYNAFLELESVVSENKASIHIVDFHAEATAEKQALAYAFDGKVSAILGTHTHIQTADERILKGGTAYITDVGMCGSYNSVIGSEKKEVLERFVTEQKTRFQVDDRADMFCAVLMDIDDKTGKAKSIERIYIHP
ncbi:MAG: TIGR00282 family metallophosphoesterase [Erysipelotrichaceae bacterium]|nr:TIGR00282 family metallophosphoesterase [Erysipelotrichaceae bacterium]